MTRVGNDLVALADFGGLRLARRILAAGAEARDARALAEHWAVKEAAYKLWRPEVGLLPREYEYDATAKTVKFGARVTQVEVTHGDEYVYAECAQNAGRIWRTIIRSEDADESRAVRAIAARLLAELAGVPAEAIRFERAPSGAPVPCNGARTLPFAVSFTHHAGFVAAAVAAWPGRA